MLYQAHKGVSTENPENTMPAVMAAIEQGYAVIEVDVAVTADGQFVLLHDSTVNRTAVKKDGSLLLEPVPIASLTYDEALAYDFGASFSLKFKGTPIPLLEEVLKVAAANGVNVKIDHKYQAFSTVQKEALFALLRRYEKTACLTCSCLEELEKANNTFPRMWFHYDGKVTDETLMHLGNCLPKERLTVWIPHRNPATQWAKVAFADETLAQKVKQYATLGLWILSRHEHLADAVALGADILETNGQLKPQGEAGLVADMHTHSEYSHDSVAPIAQMLAAQQEKGTAIVAVTDHFDTASFVGEDSYLPIVQASGTVKALREIYRGTVLPLAGIEISEGFWNPEVCRRVLDLVDYDVVIGSVHLVRYESLSYAYSQIDFSVLSDETIGAYLDAYFEDMLTMLERVDFDILAHLTCPLRYICGKFGRDVDENRYHEQVDRILKTMIRKGIALEVNTSSLGLLGDSMPPLALLERYRAMGGYLLTIGSDAHAPVQVSAGFAEITGRLRELGFTEVYYYRNRRPFPLALREYP